MVLKVNGEEIEDARIEEEVERLRPHYEQVFVDKEEVEKEAQLWDWARENVIEMALLRQQAKAGDYAVSTSEVEDFLASLKERYAGETHGFEEFSEEGKREIRAGAEAQLKMERMLAEVCKDVGEPGDEEIVKFYEENKEQFKRPEEVRVAHIVKYVNWRTGEAEAHQVMKEALEELKRGAIFETLVAKYSDCTDDGGDLGYISRGKMVEEFEDVVFNLGVGEVSGVFRTRFGFHIAKLYDRKAAVLQDLEEVRDYIAKELKEQKRSAAIESFVDRLKSEAKIEEV